MPLKNLNVRQKIGITAPFAFLAIAHLVWPNLGIDATTIVLITLASIPWILPYIKSFDFLGLGKIELNDVKSATDKIISERKDLKTDGEGKLDTANYENQKLVDALFFANLRRIAETDPNLSLVGFRVELEKRLQDLAERLDIPTKRKSIGLIVVNIEKKGILESYVISGLMELIRLGNLAAHGTEVKAEAIEWVLNAGPYILRGLDRGKNPN